MGAKVTALGETLVIKESGGTNYIVRRIIDTFHSRKTLMLILLMFVILVPGALTGAGSISVLVVGGTVAAALNAMGLSKSRVSAIIFIIVTTCLSINISASFDKRVILNTDTAVSINFTEL